MLWNAKNESIRVSGADFDYISFGTGNEPLVMLPGVGDGFQTAKGVAVPFAAAYRCFAKDYQVYVFSRRNDLPEGFTTRDMADDLDAVMEALGLRSANVFGVSQGGMIAQQLALRHPDKVGRLLLAVTAARPNDVMRDAVNTWLAMADRGDYKGIMLDTAARSYTGSYLKRAERTNQIISKFKPKDYTRFKILCRSCLEHDTYADLGGIACPVFIIGADEDRIVTGEASVELRDRIPGSELYMYRGYSHGVYEQAKDFNERVLQMLEK